MTDAERKYQRDYKRRVRGTPEGRAQNNHYSAAWRKKNARKVMLQTVRHRAKQNGIECSITLDNVTWPTHCPILGVELIYGGGRGAHPHNASIDRVDNSKGYVPGNVEVVSWRANRIKSDATAEELRAVTAWLDKRAV